MNNRMGFPALRPEEQQRFQAELLRELGKMVERYNRGNSSSIRSEKAENILGSMLYCVSVELRQAATPPRKCAGRRAASCSGAARTG